MEKLLLEACLELIVDHSDILVGIQVTALAKLPNREGLLSMLLSVLQAPIRNVAYAVKAVAEKEEDAA